MYSRIEIEEIVKSFNTQNLEKKDWTHEKHLIVAVFFLKNFEFYDAVCKLKSGIILLNHQHNTQNTAKSGYHETLTVFWATVIQEFIINNFSLDLEELVNTFLISTFSIKDYPFEFYDKEYLMSDKLRAVFYEGKN